MNRDPVKSSNLSSVGYDEQTETLEVEFKDGDVYQYAQVPAGVYRGLLSAPSLGKYFNVYVKKAGYRFTQVR